MAQPNTDLKGFDLQPQTFDRQFVVEQTIYPADLMGDNSPYGNNMVVFYISVQNDSKLEREGSVNYVSGDVLKREGTRSNLEDLKISQEVANTAIKGEVAAGGLVVGAAVGELGRSAASYLDIRKARRGRDRTPGLPARVLSKLPAALGAAAAIKSGLTRHQTKTITQAIGLYMPNNLSTTYSMGWDTQSTVLGTAAVEAMQAAYDASQSGAGLVDSTVAGAKGAGSVFGSAITSKVLSNTATASRLSATTGNPKKEQIFQGVDFRNFTFEYKFMPRSAAEAAKVQNIIRLFKLHQHPEFSPTDGSYLYLYPSEFDIRYYHRDSPTSEWTENLNIHRHTSCVLSTMTVNYGDAGVYSSFVDGHPTQISLTLQFKELALLTKENIQHGF